MTLQERLNDYKTRNKLSICRLSKITGISEPTLKDILKGARPTNGVTVQKLVTGLGSEFEEYLETKTCICGKQYIPQTYNQDFCSAICRERARGRVSLHKDPAHKLKAHEKENILEHERKFPKPKVGYAEYNERARSQGLSYGQLQGLERLGLR